VNPSPLIRIVHGLFADVWHSQVYPLLTSPGETVTLIVCLSKSLVDNTRPRCRSQLMRSTR
jgi:hypothetical protein